MVVTAWRHGPDVVGRVKLVVSRGQAATTALGRPCGSVDDICAEVRSIVEAVGRS